MEISKGQRNRLQVAMFKAAFKLGHDREVNDRFCQAILISCDSEFEKALEDRSELIWTYLNFNVWWDRVRRFKNLFRPRVRLDEQFDYFELFLKGTDARTMVEDILIKDIQVVDKTE